MSYKLKSLAIASAPMLLAGPALAQSGAPREHLAVGGGIPEAHAKVSGTQEMILIDKQSMGHYSVCNQGSHALTVAYDKSAMGVASGDCAGVEASKINVKGTDDNAATTSKGRAGPLPLTGQGSIFLPHRPIFRGQVLKCVQIRSWHCVA